MIQLMIRKTAAGIYLCVYAKITPHAMRQAGLSQLMIRSHFFSRNVMGNCNQACSAALSPAVSPESMAWALNNCLNSTLGASSLSASYLALIADAFCRGACRMHL